MAWRIRQRPPPPDLQQGSSRSLHSSMTAQISRDPFARTTLVRETVQCNDRCAWCGSRRKTGMFRYGTQRDDRGGTNWHAGLFCSKGCHDDYYR